MLNLYVCSTIDYIGTSKSLLVRFPILFINEPHTYTLLALANAPAAGPVHKNEPARGRPFLMPNSLKNDSF